MMRLMPAINERQKSYFIPTGGIRIKEKSQAQAIKKEKKTQFVLKQRKLITEANTFHLENAGKNL